MGAVRMRVQTADKNITIIHMTPVYQLTSCEVKSGTFFVNKQFHHDDNFKFVVKISIVHSPLKKQNKCVDRHYGLVFWQETSLKCLNDRWNPFTAEDPLVNK